MESTREAGSMRAVIQRVSRARVTAEAEVIGEIGAGLVILLGIGKGDGEVDADYLVEKISGLRIFDDSDGKMNLDVMATGGQALIVSQFTLHGDARRGKRPSFDDAERPEIAKTLYQYFVEKMRQKAISFQTGRFQATMQLELVNDGPVTILLDSKKTF